MWGVPLQPPVGSWDLGAKMEPTAAKRLSRHPTKFLGIRDEGTTERLLLIMLFLFFAKENWVAWCQTKRHHFLVERGIKGFCRLSWYEGYPAMMEVGFMFWGWGWGKNTLLASSRFDEKRYHPVIILFFSFVGFFLFSRLQSQHQAACPWLRNWTEAMKASLGPGPWKAEFIRPEVTEEHRK